MTLEEAAVEKLRALPLDRQREVLDFVEFLRHKTTTKRPRRSLEGLWADRNLHVTEGDIAEARREMWGDRPDR